MTHQPSHSFRHGGHSAWWRGLQDAIAVAKAKLNVAQSEDERREAQAALDRLKEQKADASQNGHRRLY